MRRPGVRWVLCLVILTFACSTTLSGRRQLTLIGDGQMNTLGASAFTDLKKQGKVSQDADLNRYIRCIAEPLLAVIPDGGATLSGRWEIVVFEDASPNAFALPGGKIGVHTGMLQVAATPGQLASVVGHEIGHVLLRHGNERMSQGVVAEGVLQAGSVAIGQMQPALHDAVVGGLGVGAQYGVLLPFSRKHESEADLLGQRMMADAGFNPAEAIDLWKRMAKLSDGQNPPEFMSTHPAHESRIAALKKNLPSTLSLYQAAKAAGRNPDCQLL
ncbi:MAG: M48 family metallopeptidase [Polyangiales bacterium]